MNFKKIMLVLLFLVVALGVGYMLYRFFFAPAPPAAPPPVVAPPVTGLPGAAPAVPPTPGVPAAPVGLPAASAVAAGGVTQTQPVAESPVLSPEMTGSGGLNYYNQDDGKFYRKMPDGSLKALSQQAFPQASDVTWTPQGDKAIIQFPDNSKVLYDFNAQRQITLPSHWQDFSFSGDGSRFATKSIGVDPDNRWLITVGSDGNNAKLIEPLGDNADQVTVSYSPDNSVVAFSETGEPLGFDTREIYLIGANNENFKSLRVEGLDFQPKWSPSGEHLIYSAAEQGDNYLPTLWFVNSKGDAIGTNRVNLGIHTWVDKCNYTDETTVYCAVPDSLPDGAGLQRDIANQTPDSIIKVDLRSGSVIRVGRPAIDTTIKDITVSPDGSTLYYTDQVNGLLSQMRLK